jgi:hypothetical protein
MRQTFPNFVIPSITANGSGAVSGAGEETRTEAKSKSALDWNLIRAEAS